MLSDKCGKSAETSSYLREIVTPVFVALFSSHAFELGQVLLWLFHEVTGYEGRHQIREADWGFWMVGLGFVFVTWLTARGGKLSDSGLIASVAVGVLGFFFSAISNTAFSGKSGFEPTDTTSRALVIACVIAFLFVCVPVFLSWLVKERFRATTVYNILSVSVLSGLLLCLPLTYIRNGVEFICLSGCFPDSGIGKFGDYEASFFIYGPWAAGALMSPFVATFFLCLHNRPLRNGTVIGGVCIIAGGLILGAIFLTGFALIGYWPSHNDSGWLGQAGLSSIDTVKLFLLLGMPPLIAVPLVVWFGWVGDTGKSFDSIWSLCAALDIRSCVLAIVFGAAGAATCVYTLNRPGFTGG